MQFMYWAEAFVTNPLWGGIASLLTIVGIIFAAIYWWVLRRQELRQLRWMQYQQTICLAWGNCPGEEVVPTALQIAAVYQLAEFREFAYMTARSLKYTAVDNPKRMNPEWIELLGPHIERVIALLQNTKAYKNQAKQFASHES